MFWSKLDGMLGTIARINTLERQNIPQRRPLIAHKELQAEDQYCTSCHCCQKGSPNACWVLLNRANTLPRATYLVTDQ